jgi:hypothetical protein
MITESKMIANILYRMLSAAWISCSKLWVGRNLLILQTLFDDVLQRLTSITAKHITNTGSEIEYAALWNRALHKAVDISRGVTDGLEAAWNTEAVEEACNRLVKCGANGFVRQTGDTGVARTGAFENCKRLAMAIGRGGCGKLEDYRKKVRMA